ncbi:MAG: glycosyltransferase family 39 protein [Nostocaceae cyanobacterium]|nr:glycosyltransferase family 39 protein [Nostocaceae cyanobacterium]
MTNDNIEKRPVLVVSLSILWLMVVGGVAFFWHLGSIGLIDETEPLFAEASRQMLITGDWITPFFNGETRFDKPALIYWCQAIAYAIVGVNEWGVRLPSAIAAMVVMCFAFYTVHWHLHKSEDLEKIPPPQRLWITPALAAAMIALNPEMIVWGRTGVSDMLLTGCIASALFCFFLGYAQPEKSSVKTRFYLGLYVLIAGGILTKGPVGIVLPGLIIGAFLLYLGKLREVLREMRPLLGILIILGLSVPWYVLVIWHNGWNYINSFFGYHNIERFTEVVNGHSAPWYFYFIVVLLGFAPYSVYLPVAMARLKFWQPKYWRSQPRSQQLGLFAFIWFAAIFGFFSIAVTKLPSYVLPLMPAAAILVALLWGDLLQEQGKRFSTGVQVNPPEKNTSSPYPQTPNTQPLILHPTPKHLTPNPYFKASAWVNVVLVSAISAALFYVPRLIGEDPAAPNFRELLQQSGLTTVGGIIWLVSAVIISVLLLRRQWLPLMGVNLLAFAGFLVFVLTPALFIVDGERQLPLRQLSATVVQIQKSGEELVMVGFKKPTVVFYSQRPVTYIKQNQAAGEYVRNQLGKGEEISSILVIAQPKKFPKMGLESSDYEKLDSRGAYDLIRVVDRLKSEG